MRRFMKIKPLTIICLVLSFCACQTPTSGIEGYVDAFKKQYPENIQSYQSPNRKMQLVWSGDPEKRPLVFVHGSPGDWEGWAQFLMNSDLQKQFQIISVDRPGYGGSQAGKTERSLARQSEDVFAALNINKSGLPAILVGHSYGGSVILKMAQMKPELVAGLVFVASSVDPGLEETMWFQIPATWWPFRVMLPNMLRVCNEEIMALKEELEVTDKEWSKLTAKVAIVQGDKDSLVPAANQDYIIKKAPDKLVIHSLRAKGVGHFIPWEHPNFIFEAIKKINKEI